MREILDYLLLKKEGLLSMKMLNHTTVCRRNRTESVVLLVVVNQSTRSLLSKNHKVSRLTFKFNFRNLSKKNRSLLAPIFTKLVTAQQNCVFITYISQSVSINFTFMWPCCIVTNFFITKPTRGTNFTNLFWH
jgi:hypothetical protein